MHRSVIILALTLSGCGSEDENVNSSIVDTRGANANIHVTADNTGNAYINIELTSDRFGSNANIQLNKSDQLWAYNYNPSNYTPDPDDLLSELAYASNNSANIKKGGSFFYNFLGFRIQGDIWYSGLIPSADDNTYYVSLLRNSYEDAIGSYVTLPDAFTITAPIINETHSRGSDLQINWQANNDNDAVDISIFTTCLNDVTDSHEIIGLTDTGTYTLPAADFTPGATGQCNTNIEIVKAKIGQLSPNFKSGIITGNRVDKTVFISTN